MEGEGWKSERTKQKIVATNNFSHDLSSEKRSELGPCKFKSLHSFLSRNKVKIEFIQNNKHFVLERNKNETRKPPRKMFGNHFKNKMKWTLQRGSERESL